MTIDFEIFDSIKGFMAKDEAQVLYKTAHKASLKGPVLEIGSYCGKSAYVIGTACKENDSILFSIDHHQGSEEQQYGEAYFDSELFDTRTKKVNTLPFFLETLEKSFLMDSVIPMIATSEVAGKKWQTPLSMVFIDGGHSFEAANTDFMVWTDHIIKGGFLVIHDIFFDPDQGGQAPRQIYEKALDSKQYSKLEMQDTLGILIKN